jgi:glyoxylate/hydroxypyruvate/2-ketogluconate reductase
MKPKLLITRKVFPEVTRALSESFEVVGNPDDALWGPAELAQRIAGCQALFCTGSDRVDAALMSAAPELKIVATGSVGFNHVDLAYCRSHGIALTNTPDVLTAATADMAWTLLMAAGRRVSESERWLREGHWKRWAFDQFLGADFEETTLGIVGMGRIGSAVARRASGFSMKLIYCNRSPAPNERELGATRVPLDTLLSTADHVVLVLPYSPQTHHLIGARELALMKPTATLVNIARGGIIDDRALAAALRNGQIGAAGLDVFEGEPALASELLALSNVVLTPHIGSSTLRTRLAMAMLAARNLLAWADGQPLLTPVA